MSPVDRHRSILVWVRAVPKEALEQSRPTIPTTGLSKAAMIPVSPLKASVITNSTEEVDQMEQITPTTPNIPIGLQLLQVPAIEVYLLHLNIESLVGTFKWILSFTGLALYSIRSLETFCLRQSYGLLFTIPSEFTAHEKLTETQAKEKVCWHDQMGQLPCNSRSIGHRLKLM